MHELVLWYKTEYARRTHALESNTGRIDWIDPGTRVSWTEVLSKAEQLGLDVSDVVSFRIAFDNYR